MGHTFPPLAKEVVTPVTNVLRGRCTLPLAAGTGMVVTLDVKLLLLHGPALLGLLFVVNVEADPFAGIDAQPLFQHLSDPEYAVGLGGVGQPHG